MHDDDFLAERLRDLGRQPVDPATTSRHLSAMAAVGGSSGRFWTRLKVGAAFGAGLLIGGTGLASAGALPGPAQGVANKTLAKVGVNVPHGTERFNDPAVCGTDPNTGQPFKNHGQYVRANKANNPAAAQSRCGKPLQAGGPDGATPAVPGGAPVDPGQQGQGQGNAGPGNSGRAKDKAAKDEAKAARKKAEAEEKQGAQPAEPPKEPKAEPPKAEGKPATTVTTAATTTTSTTSISVPQQP